MPASSLCSGPSSHEPCPTRELVTTGSHRCPACAAAADAARGSSAERGYTGEHRTRFRDGVLRKHPWCVLHLEAGLRVPSVHADHHPRSRRELVAAGLDANDPVHGRGLCGPCHSSETARLHPAGWHDGARGGG